MAAPRFYRVLMGHQGDEAKTKYLEYLRTRGQNKVGTASNGRNRPERIALYLDPFGLDLAATQVLQASAEVPSWNAVKGVGAVSTRVVEAVPANAIAFKLKGVKAARVTYKTGVSTTGTDKRSHLTGLEYKKYGGTNFSFPFGALNNTETITEAFTAIKTGLTAAGIGVAKTIRLVDEEI